MSTCWRSRFDDAVLPLLPESSDYLTGFCLTPVALV